MFSPEFVTSARVVDDVLVVGLRLNWFRPLPLSCVEELTVLVDGTPLPQGVLVLDGIGFPVEQLVDQDDVWWRLSSDAEFRLPWADQEPPDEVRVIVRTRIPLLVDHTGSPVVVTDTASVAVAA